MTFLKFSVTLTLCSLAYASRLKQLALQFGIPNAVKRLKLEADCRFSSTDDKTSRFQNMDKLVTHISDNNYKREVLDALWKDFETECGESAWFEFLNSKVEYEYGSFTSKLIQCGRMATCSEITLRNGKKYCLRLPSNFNGYVWSKTQEEHLRAADYVSDLKNHPCTSLVQYKAIDPVYQLLYLLGKDLSTAKLSSEQAMPMMRDLLNALDTLHSEMGRAHGDCLGKNICAPLAKGDPFTLVDVLTLGKDEFIFENVEQDLLNIKDMPSKCFSAELERVVNKLAKTAETFDKTNKVYSLFWRRSPFTGKVTQTRISTRALAGTLDKIKEHDDFLTQLPNGLLREAELLSRGINQISEISKDISQRISQAGKDVHLAKHIAGEVLATYFSEDPAAT